MHVANGSRCCATICYRRQPRWEAMNKTTVIEKTQTAQSRKIMNGRRGVIRSQEGRLQEVSLHHLYLTLPSMNRESNSNWRIKAIKGSKWNKCKTYTERWTILAFRTQCTRVYEQVWCVGWELSGVWYVLDRVLPLSCIPNPNIQNFF